LDTNNSTDKLDRKTLIPGVSLSCIYTDKFKTGYFSVFFIRSLSKTEAAKNALLPSVLLRGSKSLPDMTAIAARLGELYGASIDPMVRQMGETQAVGLSVSFADDRYLPGGEKEKILEKVTALTGELLLDPHTKGGLLSSDYVASEKSNLTERIRSLVNNKAAYALERMKSKMFKNESYGIYLLGTAESAEKITASALTKHYKRLLETSRIEMFYCGSAEPERIYSAVSKAFRTLPNKEPRVEPKPTLIKTAADKKARVVTESMNVTQGNLVLGFRLGEIMNKPDYAALSVFNAVYGGSINSKLFLNVRERLSLCYTVSSSIERSKGIMTVSSGIDFDKYDEALNEISEQLRLCREGEISEEELNTAKKTIITDIRSMTDSAKTLDAYWLRQALSGLDYGPDIYAALIEEVTKEDVLKVANSVKLDTVYFLKGLE
jgi:predicted Zn-dependent peptidase